jgi:hypothetical protein
MAKKPPESPIESSGSAEHPDLQTYYGIVGSGIGLLSAIFLANVVDMNWILL